MTTPWTFARCDTRWCHRGVDLQWSAEVCLHGAVSCEGCRPEDACDECATAEWEALADPFADPFANPDAEREDIDTVTAKCDAYAEQARAASRWVLGGGDRG